MTTQTNPTGSVEHQRSKLRFGPWFTVASLVALLQTACASPQAPSTTTHAEHAHHGHAATTEQQTQLPRAQSLQIPAADPSGPDRQVHTLLHAAHVRIVSIRLRNGSTLPEHSSTVPVIIQAVAGSGTITVGSEQFPLDTGRFITLAANVSHAVTPATGTELLLLVHHLGETADHH